MTFRVGQKVVCINATPKYGNWDDDVPVPVQGNIYTVSQAPFPAPPETDYGDGITIISLAELPNPYGGYDVIRFRPIVEPKAEISFTTGADPSSDQFDNRRKVRKKIGA